MSRERRVSLSFRRRVFELKNECLNHKTRVMVHYRTKIRTWQDEGAGNFLLAQRNEKLFLLPLQRAFLCLSFNE